MRVLVCPTAFKESLTSIQVADAVSSGVLRALPDARIRRMPVSDGGPGLLHALSAAAGGEVRTHKVHGPLGGPVPARSLWVSPTEAVVESADACGLHLVPPGERDAMRTCTRGVGELVKACLALGASSVTVGLGGSATVDGGTGLGRSFGYGFTGADGRPLPYGGGSLRGLERIDEGDAPAPGVALTALADVRSPLCGPDGAAVRFAGQKGATSAQVDRLAEGLARLGERMRIDLGRDVADVPGAGAAGGLGAGCAAFLGADLVTGSDWVLERLGFGDALAEADLLITGEGSWDGTSDLGKITSAVLQRAGEVGVPSVLVCGEIHGSVPAGVTSVSGSGAWLAAGDVARLVADVLG